MENQIRGAQGVKYVPALDKRMVEECDSQCQHIASFVTTVARLLVCIVGGETSAPRFIVLCLVGETEILKFQA